MKSSNPNFSQFSKIEEDALIARLEAIRQTISHAGEKGRALESEVAALISSFLPSEYGISTGFIAYRTNEVIELSPQLDLIIYDALRSGPIARLGSCDVFPLEATYAYIEVKASEIKGTRIGGRSFRAFLTSWLIYDRGCGMPRLARLDAPGVLHHG